MTINMSRNQSRILIVDDDPGTVRALAEILKDIGKVHFTTKSTDAVEMAMSVAPDFIILDVEMPELNGIDVCALIKSNPAFNDVPVLFVTAHSDIDIETRALTAGAIDFIEKPPHPLLVETRVRNYLALKQRTDHLKKLALAVEQSSESVIITDIDGNIEYVNDTFLRNTGYSQQEVIGENPRILASGKTPAETFVELWSALTGGKNWKGEFINRRKDGSEYIELVTISPIRQPDGKITHYLSVQTDITHQKAAEDQIRRLAYFDTLTQLPNRRHFQDRLDQAIAASQRSKRYGVVIIIDFDNFKLINDTWGHSIGERFLCAISMRLRNSCVRAADLIARFGGDEFAFLLEDINDDYTEAARQVEICTQKILRTIDQPIEMNAVEYHITASAGLYLFSNSSDEDVDKAIKRAEAAMYRAKIEGRNRLCFFDPDIQAKQEERAKLEAALHSALVRNQFRIVFQPQIGTDDRVTGAEVLLRWEHPELGMVSPLEFIALAEETGLIIPIGLWVLKSACHQLRRWNNLSGWESFTLSVNISSRQLHQEDFIANVSEIILETGVSAKNLTLELTESAILKNVEDSIEKMNVLKARGLSFSMDDFGTGYSSLSYLKRLPVNELKIDQSFVRDLGIDLGDEVIVRTIIAMGQSLGLSVIAEGVETAFQHELVRGYGCHHFQGYLFGRPQDAKEFESNHFDQSSSLLFPNK
ncbi:EAL domain-containing protein [Methylomonas sp. OY6]|uniref:EAL domain-containing protein n=1 Tax=Methylomonas defluvii TaxID=3045149 RepID=A0ABU4UA34_9GAMM|nr:EAL domain-containing protein [Methylomonas sp. OY6]MDX8125862.1 EAL domain-containing protein [Methylomonas sp. OY6]